MDKKKRWIVKNSQFKSRTEAVSISWSSSDTEDNTVSFTFRKKFKSENNSFLHDKTNEKQFCEEFFNEAESLFNNCSGYSKDDIESSPILYGNVRLSPVLSKQENPSLSPVISKKSKLREIKRKIYSKNAGKRSGVTQDFQCLSTKRVSLDKMSNASVFRNSPDIFASEDKFLIEVEDSQETQPQYFHINDTSSDENEKIHIDENTQNRSSEKNDNSVINSLSSCSKKSISNTEPVLFYYKVPKKKRYKKGGFARQLQKSLHNQRMSVAIWKHEVYLNKEHRCELEGDCIDLKIVRKFQEFGSDLLECSVVVNNIKNNCDTSSNRTTKCIVLLNKNVRYDIGEKKLSLYMPFNVKSILHNGEFLDCYYNVVKVIC